MSVFSNKELGQKLRETIKQQIQKGRAHSSLIRTETRGAGARGQTVVEYLVVYGSDPVQRAVYNSSIYGQAVYGK